MIQWFCTIAFQSKTNVVVGPVDINLRLSSGAKLVHDVQIMASALSRLIPRHHSCLGSLSLPASFFIIVLGLIWILILERGYRLNS